MHNNILESQMDHSEEGAEKVTKEEFADKSYHSQRGHISSLAHCDQTYEPAFKLQAVKRVKTREKGDLNSHQQKFNGTYELYQPHTLTQVVQNQSREAEEQQQDKHHNKLVVTVQQLISITKTHNQQHYQNQMQEAHNNQSRFDQLDPIQNNQNQLVLDSHTYIQGKTNINQQSANYAPQSPIKQSYPIQSTPTTKRPSTVLAIQQQFKNRMDNIFANQSAATWRHTSHRYSFTKSQRFDFPSNSRCPDILVINLPSTLSKVSCTLNRGGNIPLTDPTPTQTNSPFIFNSCRAKWEKRDSKYTPAPNAYHIEGSTTKSKQKYVTLNSSTPYSNKRKKNHKTIKQQSKQPILVMKGFETLKAQKQASSLPVSPSKPSSPRKGRCTFGLPWSKYSHTYVPHRQDIATREALQAKIKDKQMHENEIKSLSLLGEFLNGIDMSIHDGGPSSNMSSQIQEKEKLQNTVLHLMNRNRQQTANSANSNRKQQGKLEMRKNRSIIRPSSRPKSSKQISVPKQSQNQQTKRNKSSASNFQSLQAKQLSPFSPISHHSHFAPRFSMYGRLEMFSQKVARQKVWVPAPWDTQGKTSKQTKQYNRRDHSQFVRKQECGEEDQSSKDKQPAIQIAGAIKQASIYQQINPQQFSTYRRRSKYFSTGNRIDLSRPANLNPGAKYDIGRWPNITL